MEEADFFTPYSGPGTSEEAAESMRFLSRDLRARVHAYIKSKGKDGATDQEITDGLSMDSNTSRPRRWELYREGKICKSGFTRKTISNRSADVWVSVEFKDDLQDDIGPGEGSDHLPVLVHEDGRDEMAGSSPQGGEPNLHAEGM